MLVCAAGGGQFSFFIMKPSESRGEESMSLNIAKIALRKLKTAWGLARSTQIGFYTPWELTLAYVNYTIAAFAHKDYPLHLKAGSRRLKKEYLRDGVYVFKEARLPSLNPADEIALVTEVGNAFFVYLKHDDCYDEAKINKLYEFLPDGPYGLRNEQVNVTVEKGDIVLDAGSWIGDFAAYASAKGAVTYAFEPSDKTYEYLLQTAKLNKNVHPVKKGLGNAKTAGLLQSEAGSSTTNRIVSESSAEGAQPIEITTIDDFVKENGLPRVDFIKADIEGYERYMLEGAQETLKNFAPKLALCTYHLPDDPEVLEKLIKKANPAYCVVQKKKKLYASVSGKHQ
jgi:FkbM family methyltransferase